MPEGGAAARCFALNVSGQGLMLHAMALGSSNDRRVRARPFGASGDVDLGVTKLIHGSGLAFAGSGDSIAMSSLLRALGSLPFHERFVIG